MECGSTRWHRKQAHQEFRFSTEIYFIPRLNFGDGTEPVEENKSARGYLHFCVRIFLLQFLARVEHRSDFVFDFRIISIRLSILFLVLYHGGGIDSGI